MNGEQGTSKSVSTWRFILLERKTPTQVWVYTLTSGLFIFGAQVFVRRKIRNNNNS
jgi:hypothetical protein